MSDSLRPYGVLQARILEWVAMPSSRGSFRPRIKPTPPASPALQVDSLLLSHQGSPGKQTDLKKMYLKTEAGLGLRVDACLLR